MKKYLFLFVAILFAVSSCTTRVVTTTPSHKVVVVKKAPSYHKVVVVNGKRYYRWDGNYYRKTNNGYVVVKIR